MKGATIPLVTIISALAIWCGWLTNMTVNNSTNLASVNTSLSDIKDTVHEIAQHDGILSDSSSIEAFTPLTTK